MTQLSVRAPLCCSHVLTSTPGRQLAEGNTGPPCHSVLLKTRRPPEHDLLQDHGLVALVGYNRCQESRRAGSRPDEAGLLLQVEAGGWLGGWAAPPFPSQRRKPRFAEGRRQDCDRLSRDGLHPARAWGAWSLWAESPTAGTGASASPEVQPRPSEPILAGDSWPSWPSSSATCMRN